MQKEYHYLMCQDCGEKYDIMDSRIAHTKVCEECGSRRIYEYWEYEKEEKE